MKPSAKYADLSGKMFGRLNSEEEHMNNREIAERLGISVPTVKRYPKESGIALTISLDQLPTMIAELSAINRKLDALTVTTEMW